jgi:hypothetical protein
MCLPERLRDKEIGYRSAGDLTASSVFFALH